MSLAGQLISDNNVNNRPFASILKIPSRYVTIPPLLVAIDVVVVDKKSF